MDRSTYNQAMDTLEALDKSVASCDFATRSFSRTGKV